MTKTVNTVSLLYSIMSITKINTHSYVVNTNCDEIVKFVLEAQISLSLRNYEVHKYCT